jgi:hypothetical protein
VASSGFVRVQDSAASKNFIIAPSGDLTLQDAVVLTHQVSVVVKLQTLK